MASTVFSSHQLKSITTNLLKDTGSHQVKSITVNLLKDTGTHQLKSITANLLKDTETHQVKSSKFSSRETVIIVTSIGQSRL